MGRGYATISPGFWAGHTGRKIRAMGPSAQLVALYLITCPSSSPTGVYYLPLPTLAHETNCTLEEARCILQALSSVEFATYDEVEEMVWVPNMAREQIDEIVKMGDNRWKWLVKEVESFRASRFFAPFLERYRGVFNLQSVFEAPSMDLVGSSEAPSKPLQSPSEGASGESKEPEQAPPKPAASLSSIIKQHHSTAAAAEAPVPAPAAAAFNLGLPPWMDQELQGLGLSEKHASDLLQRLGLDGIRDALFKLRSKTTRSPAGLILRKAEELAQEGHGQLDKNLKRALTLYPGALQAFGWPRMPPELQGDSEVAIAWCMFLRANQDEAGASEQAKAEFGPIRAKAEEMFVDLVLARHPHPSGILAEVDKAAKHSPPGWKSRARCTAVLRTLELVPMKSASGGL